MSFTDADLLKSPVLLAIIHVFAGDVFPLAKKEGKAEDISTTMTAKKTLGNVEDGGIV